MLAQHVTAAIDIGKVQHLTRIADRFHQRPQIFKRAEHQSDGTGLKDTHSVINKERALSFQKIDQRFFRWQTKQEVIVRSPLHYGNTTIKIIPAFPLRLPRRKFFSRGFSRRRRAFHVKGGDQIRDRIRISNILALHP